MSELPQLREHVYLLDLLLYRPNAFLLLSYIKFRTLETQLYPLPFSIKDISGGYGKVLLNAAQVRSNLKILSDAGFIKIERLKFPPKVRHITILQKGIIDG